jgi:hypothetical protein
MGDDLVLIRPFKGNLHAKTLQTLKAKFSVSYCDTESEFINVKDKTGMDHLGVYADRFELANKYPNPPHKHVNEMIAFAEGADIEYLNTVKEWTYIKDPSWGLCNKYRIKPQKTAKQTEIERIESALRKQAEITAKLADDLSAVKAS